MSFIYVADGIDDVLAAHLNQYADAWSGVAGKGQPLNMVAVNDPINFAISARNLDPTNSRTLQLLKADGTVLFQCDASGVKVSPDGTLASVPVTTTATQTLTNKTLTSPVITGPTLSGGVFGAAATWNPTMSQGASITLSVANGFYIQLGKMVFFTADITCNSAGTVGAAIAVGNLPALSQQRGVPCHGWGSVGGGVYRLIGQWNSSSTFTFWSTDGGAGNFGAAQTIAVGSQFHLTGVYEAT